MRVTAETRRRTRTRLLEAAEGLVRKRGFEGITTRDVAALAEIGHGTLFNYFASREAMGLALCDVFLSRAAADTGNAANRARRRAPTASLEEDLFSHASACLRRLQPLRPSAGALLAGLLALPDVAPAEADDDAPGQPARVLHRIVDTVRGFIAARRAGPPPSPAMLRLYASLFIGTVCSWSVDSSPHQEDTLALLDQATRLFVQALDEQDDGRAGKQGKD